MKNSTQARWIDLGMAAAVTVIVPIVAMIGWPILSERLAGSSQGEVLIYEVDPESTSGESTIDMPLLIKTIDRRINADNHKLAEVRLLEDGRIEVALLRKNKDEQETVEQSLAHPTTLEFRILANDPHDKALIERATSDSSSTRIVDGKGNVLGRWIPVNTSAMKGLKEHKDIALRTRKQGKNEITEVLIVQDPLNLTGAYLTGVKNGYDRLGRPELSFLFNTKGGHLLQDLTGSHLPDQSDGLIYKLGVIINGELRFAPGILSRIFNCANIANTSPKQEAKELAAMLNKGCISARVRLVKKTPAPAP
jgi:preprotein translocase subunit SecD